MFNVYIDAVEKEMKMGMGRREKSGDSLASCMQMSWFCVVSQEDLMAVVGCFVQVCGRRGLHRQDTFRACLGI